MRWMIFGVTGQLGHVLSNFLLEKGYEVVGVSRRSSLSWSQRLEGLPTGNPNFVYEEGDVTDLGSIISLLAKHAPHYVVNLAAMSHVATSFYQPSLTWQVVAGGALNCLEAIRLMPPASRPRFWQASSSEMFGSSIDEDGFQRETTRMCPQSPYAIAKLAAHHAVRVYRESYGLFACAGIMFNAESEFRSDAFVTRKISKYVADVVKGRSRGHLKLGNVNAKRDWTWAGDTVAAIEKMLLYREPDDFVIATSATHTVKEFWGAAIKAARLHSAYYETDASLTRPLEVDALRGDFSKAHQKLGWAPTKDFYALVEHMVQHDLEAA